MWPYGSNREDLVKMVQPLCTHTHTHTHTHTGVLFGACQLVTLHTQPKAKQARSSVTLSSHGLLLPPPGLVKTLLGTTPRVIQNVGTYP